MEKKDYVTKAEFNERLNEVDKRFDKLDQRFDEFASSMSKQFAEVIDAIGHYASGSERKVDREVYASRTHARDLVREHEKAMH